MAEKVDLEVTLKEQAAEASRRAREVKGGGKNRRDLNLALQEMQKFSKYTALSSKDLRDYSKSIKEVNRLVMRIADTMKPMPAKLKQLGDSLEKNYKGLNKNKTGFSYAEIARRAKGAGVLSSKGDPMTESYMAQALASGNWKNWQNADRIPGIQKQGEQLAQRYQVEKAEFDKLTAEQVELKGDNKIYIEAATSNMNIDEAVRESAPGGNVGPTESLSLPSAEETNKRSTSLGKAFKQFSIYTLTIKALKTALRSTVVTVRDLDKYLTEQAMVTGKTRQETYALLNSYQKLAQQTGATTKEVAEVATQFMRQGKTAKEALTLTEAAVSAAKVASISATDSVNYLTTALNGFRLSAEDAMRVSDKFAAIAAQSASSYEEIAIALSKVASQANLAGMSIDYTTALLAKGLETTREAPETIGTALKTVIARMREMGDYGETLEGDTNINNVEKQLSYVGIELRNVQGELRSTEDVLDELGHKWDDLNSNQQAAIAKALAGTRQQSRLIAMMQDYERVTELQQISQRSAGATAAQARVYTEGLEASINKIKVSIEGITTSLAKNQVVLGIVNTVSKVIENINKLLSDSRISTIALVSLFGTLLVLGTKNLALRMAAAGYAKLEKAQNAQIALLNAEQNLQKAIENKESAAQILLLTRQKQILAEQAGVQTGLTFSEKIKNIFKGIGIKLGLIQIKQEEKILALKQAQKGIWGLIAAIAVAAIAAIVVLVVNWKSETEKLNDSMSELSDKIYTVNKKAQEIKQVTKAYDELDQKIIKTAADQEEMNKLLESAGDSLSAERKKNSKGQEQEGTSEQDIYGQLTTNASRRKYLDKIKKDAEDEANRYRRQQIQRMRSVSADARNAVLTGTSSADLKTQDAIYAINNAKLYDVIDNMGGAADGVEEFTQSILENMSALDAWRYAEDQTGKGIQSLINSINSVEVEVETASGKESAAATKVLNSESYSLSERTKAYEELRRQIELTNDDALISSFKQTYAEWETFSNLFSNNLDFIDSVGLNAEKINDLSSAIRDLGYNAQASVSLLNDLFDTIEGGTSLDQAIEYVFGYAKGTTQYNQILRAYSDAVGVGALNMGQNLTSLKNQINSVYEKALGWGSMSDADKTAFMKENQGLFEGKQGAELLRAFETGDFNQIEKALQSSSFISDITQKRIKEVERDLELELAKAEEDQDAAYIKYLQEQREFLLESGDLYKASLETRLNQEKKQLDIYKESLNKQKELLEDSLNKRKDAYNKYFDAVKQEEEDKEFEEEEGILISNLTKLASSDNATSKQQTKELEQKLEELEKERLKDLQERARQAVLDNIDDQLQNISDKFDKLLENNQALLNAMLTGGESNPAAFATSLLSSNLLGKSEVEARSYIEDFKANFGSILSADVLDKITVEKSASGDNLILNIAGTPIEIGESSQQDLYNTIMNALKQLGIRA